VPVERLASVTLIVARGMQCLMFDNAVQGAAGTHELIVHVPEMFVDLFALW
jgi:hypothetical protein